MNIPILLWTPSAEQTATWLKELLLVCGYKSENILPQCTSNLVKTDDVAFFNEQADCLFGVLSAEPTADSPFPSRYVPATIVDAITEAVIRGMEIGFLVDERLDLPDSLNYLKTFRVDFSHPASLLSTIPAFVKHVLYVRRVIGYDLVCLKPDGENLTTYTYDSSRMNDLTSPLSKTTTYIYQLQPKFSGEDDAGK